MVSLLLVKPHQLTSLSFAIRSIYLQLFQPCQITEIIFLNTVDEIPVQRQDFQGLQTLKERSGQRLKFVVPKTPVKRRNRNFQLGSFGSSSLLSLTTLSVWTHSRPWGSFPTNHCCQDCWKKRRRRKYGVAFRKTEK